MAIIARSRDKHLSYNSVEMTQKSYFLMVAKPGFGPGSGASVWIWSRLTAVNRDHFEATETASHCFPSPGIFIAMRYNCNLNSTCYFLFCRIYLYYIRCCALAVTVDKHTTRYKLTDKSCFYQRGIATFFQWCPKNIRRNAFSI